jgi:putative membrane protein
MIAMDDTTRRDQLAVERTRLANERTFLAYVRTALVMAASGAAIFHFYPNSPSLVLTAWCLLLGGGGILAIGLYRFYSVRARLAASPGD